MEKVLCVKRNHLPSKWVETKTAIKINEPDFYKQCSAFSFDFILRENVENNPDFKQIIPYIIILSDDLKKVAVYKRKGSEKRLHDLWSVGIGGHINPVDSKNNLHSLKENIISGMTRELDEELIKRPDNDKPVFIGIINDEETDVSSVHIGAVYRILTGNPQAYTSGNELSDFQWLNINEAKRLNLELWSSLALELI